uniref:protein-tyrosine-phosphatase n=1 Tax=Arcella intermedia TaxID=1963864 RepID=A0A6B2LHY7_9EUKA
MHLQAEAYEVLRYPESRFNYDTFGYHTDASLIIPNLWLGAASAAQHEIFLKQARIGTVISIHMAQAFLPDRFNHTIIPLEDHPFSALLPELDATYESITLALNSGSAVLVHCVAGASRSASVVIAYMMKSRGWTYEEAYDFVKEKRRVVEPNSGFVAQLKLYQKMRCSLDGESEAHLFYRSFLSGPFWNAKLFYQEQEKMDYLDSYESNE